MPAPERPGAHWTVPVDGRLTDEERRVMDRALARCREVARDSAMSAAEALARICAAYVSRPADPYFTR